MSVPLRSCAISADAVEGPYKKFALDTPELVGGAGVWLATDEARFLSGRFVSANWSVEDLRRMKEQIEAGDDLKLVYQGKLGLEE